MGSRVLTPPGPLLHVPHCRPARLTRKLPGCSAGPWEDGVIELRFAEVLQEVRAVQDPIDQQADQYAVSGSFRAGGRFPELGSQDGPVTGRDMGDLASWTPWLVGGRRAPAVALTEASAVPAGGARDLSASEGRTTGAGQSRCWRRGPSRGRAASSRVLSVLLCPRSGVPTPSAVLTRLWAAHDAGRPAVTLAVGTWSTSLSLW